MSKPRPVEHTHCAPPRGVMMIKGSTAREVSVDVSRAVRVSLQEVAQVLSSRRPEVVINRDTRRRRRRRKSGGGGACWGGGVL